jgi:hypothetical protein
MKGVHGKPYICMDAYTHMDQLKSIVPDINYGIAKSHALIRLNYGIENHDEYVEDIKGAYNRWRDLETDTRLKQYGLELEQSDKVAFHYWLMYQYPVYEALNYLVIREFDRDINEPYLPYDAHKTNPYQCRWTEAASHFPTLIDWAQRLPFQTLGPIVLLLKNSGLKTVRHRDCFLQPEPYDQEEQFIWFDPCGARTLYVENDQGQQILMQPGHSFYWNNHDWHGGVENTNKVSWSMRVEGVFDHTLVQQLKKS